MKTCISKIFIIWLLSNPTSSLYVCEQSGCCTVILRCNIGKKAFDTYLNGMPSSRYFYEDFLNKNTFKSKKYVFHQGCLFASWCFQLKMPLAEYPRSNELHSLSKKLTSFMCKCLGLSVLSHDFSWELTLFIMIMTKVPPLKNMQPESIGLIFNRWFYNIC